MQVLGFGVLFQVTITAGLACCVAAFRGSGATSRLGGLHVAQPSPELSVSDGF